MNDMSLITLKRLNVILITGLLTTATTFANAAVVSSKSLGPEVIVSPYGGATISSKSLGPEVIVSPYGGATISSKSLGPEVHRQENMNISNAVQSKESLNLNEGF